MYSDRKTLLEHSVIKRLGRPCVSTYIHASNYAVHMRFSSPSPHIQTRVPQRTATNQVVDAAIAILVFLHGFLLEYWRGSSLHSLRNLPFFHSPPSREDGGQ